LSAGGNGVQLSGFNFGFTAKNGNGWDDARQDYLAAYVKLYNAGGGLAANYDYSAQTNRKYNWTNFSFSETFANPIAASQYSNAQVGFVGRDNNFWAGNYGPEIYNVSFSLKYRVDPCATNPAYSPNCSGFNNVVTSNNILPQPDTWGTSINQIVAINTALKNGGIGATVHGFNYGFDYTVGQSWSGCTATNQDGSCSWYMNIPARAGVTAQLTNSNNQSLFSRNHTLTGDGTSGSVSGQYLLPTSLSQTSMGNVRLYGSTSGAGSSIGNFSASLIYTADPCVTNPLYSTLCSGYAVAFAKNMLLGSTVASASGAIVSSGGSSNLMSTNTGAGDQSQGNTQQEQTQQSQQTQQQGQQTQQQSSPSATQDASQNPSVAQDNPSQPSPTQQGPATTTPQPAGGPPQTATASASSSSGPSGGGGGPSKLAMSVVKSAQANDKATQNAAVQNAAKTLENATQSSQASSNAAITMNQDMSANSSVSAAAFASQSTQTSIQSSQQSSQQLSQSNTQTQQSNRVTQQMQQTQTQQVQSFSGSTQIQQFVYTPPVQQQQDTQSTQVAMLKPPTPVIVETQQQSSSGTGLTITRNMFSYSPLMSLNISNTSITIQQQQPTYQPKLDTQQSETETPQFQIASFGGGRAGNPLSEILMQQRFELMQNNITQPTSSVNRNVQPNDLAVGVDIASMASVPAGFSAYSIVLKDATFYEPKEVYKNQRTVDNERVLRGLTRGSDSLHQRMVDQQYKIGE
jgi:hypothetical protein